MKKYPDVFYKYVHVLTGRIMRIISDYILTEETKDSKIIRLQEELEKLLISEVHFSKGE
jgi:hypothetical protein